MIVDVINKESEFKGISILPSEGSIMIDIYINGEKTVLGFALYSALVHFELNKLPLAKFTFIAPDSLTNSEYEHDYNLMRVKHGEEAKIKVDIRTEENEPKSLFKGIITAFEIKNEGNSRLLKIECKDELSTLAKEDKIKVENAKNFGEIFKASIPSESIGENISGVWNEEEMNFTKGTVPWDFLVGFLDSVGILTAVKNGKFNGLDVNKDNPDKYYRLTHGVNIFSFKGNSKKSKPLSKFTIECKEDGKEEVKVFEYESKKIKDNPDSKSLNNIPYSEKTLNLQAKSWVNKSKHWGLVATVGTFGNLMAKVGDFLKCYELHDDVNAKPLLITAEAHTIENGCWKTEYTLGLEGGKSFAENAASKSSEVSSKTGLAKGIKGIHLGIVSQLEGDEKGEFRIRVKIAAISNQSEGVWARLGTLFASQGFGGFFIPDIGDEVIVAFLDENPNNPIVLGSLYSKERNMPEELTDDNLIKTILSKEGSTIKIDDEKKSIEISTKNGNKVLVSEEDKGILLEDENKNKIVMNDGGITLESSKDFKIEAKGNVEIKGMALKTEASANNVIKGATIQLN